MAIVRRIEGLTWIVTFGSALLASSCGSSTPASSANGAAGSSAGGDELSQAGGALGGAPDSAAGGKSSVAGASSGGADNTPLTECPKSAIVILFSPMYSAYDGVHTFQVPAIVDSLDPSVINWSASDDSMVKLETTSGGVMITTRKAGKVSIIASAGSLCGASVLTITDATPDDWMAGSDRYNSGVDITRLPGMMGRPGGGMGGAGGGSGTGGAGGATGTDAKCTSCHGDTAATGPYKTVQHTPEQTGGFSDAQLINIFENGAFPNGAKDVNFNATIVAYAQWQAFHKWDPGGAEKGLVVYLRSLTPAAQTGEANFGRMGMGGGMGGGGRPGRGGGGGAGGGGGLGGIGGVTAGAGGTGGSTTSAGSGGTTSGGTTSGGGTGGA